MSNVISLVTALLIVMGALISLISAIGILRFPDLFTRMHAASKAGFAGSGLSLVAVAVHSGEVAIWIKCLAAVVFFALTAPLSAHLLAKAALRSGAKSRHFDRQKRI
ncbi:MAG: monovalent cation/proton antiporter, MnhG/PhaG subunit [Rhizobium sp.]|nr:monovalent cation/proton antiporter, MnhG/PhaG subunit [Rhizobium sp.]